MQTKHVAPQEIAANNRNLALALPAKHPELHHKLALLDAAPNPRKSQQQLRSLRAAAKFANVKHAAANAIAMRATVPIVHVASAIAAVLAHAAA